TNVPGLNVPAASTSFALKKRNASIGEIGRLLNVQYVTECSVRKAENELRISVQLVKVADSVNIWSKTFPRELKTAKDVFAVQEEIAHAITDALRVSMPTE